jgi:hypothetical protein
LCVLLREERLFFSGGEATRQRRLAALAVDRVGPGRSSAMSCTTRRAEDKDPHGRRP